MILEHNFNNFIHVDYKYIYSCSESGCDMEGICRCGEIINPCISDVYVSRIANEIYSIYFDGGVSSKRSITIQSLWGITPDLNKYAIDRILRHNKIWSPLNWDVNISNGYYGQEIEDILFVPDVGRKIEKEIEYALNIDSKEKLIYHLIEIEYGFVLDKLKNKSFFLKTVPITDIVFGNDKHFKNVIKEDLDFYSDRNYNGIRGVAIKSGKKYKIIDGYHRCSKTENEYVKILVAE